MIKVPFSGRGKLMQPELMAHERDKLMIKHTLSLMFALMIAWHLSALAETSVSVTDADETQVHQVLDGFHDAADKGDKVRYLNYFSDKAVFMGTDDWERWPLSEFRVYVDKRFKDGKGWSYKPLERHVAFSGSGSTAWFDEITFSEKWGRFRGTGVLVKEHKQWKIAHYSMSMLVPNDAWQEISTIARRTYAELEEAKDDKDGKVAQ